MRIINHGLCFVFLIIAMALNGAPQAHAAGQYDLAITAFRAAPAGGTISTSFVYYVTIRNMGSTPALLKDLGIERNDDVMQSATTRPWGSQTVTLSPGQTYDCSVSRLFGSGTGTLPAGRHIMKATINHFNLAEDQNPANNSFYVPVEVIDPSAGDPGWPDLYIRDVYTMCDGKMATGLNREVPSGRPVTIALHPMENIGKQPAFLPKGLLLMQATENGQPVGSMVVDKTHIMKAGKGFHYEFEIPAAKLIRPGAHEIRITADPHNAVRESNDNNNLWAFFITVKGSDLAVTGVTAAPSDPSTRHNITLSVTVKNMSTGQAVYSPQGVPFLSYGSPNKTYQMAAPANLTLAAGQEYRTTLTVPAFAPNAGSYNLTVAVDKTGDPNPANNTFTLPVTLRNPRPSEMTGTSSKGVAPPPGSIVQPMQQPINQLPNTAPPKVTTPGAIR